MNIPITFGSNLKYYRTKNNLTQKHPEKYPDLIVRITGFSAKFLSLSPEWQQEVLTRNFYD